MFDKVLGSSWEFVMGWNLNNYTLALYRKGASYALHSERYDSWSDAITEARIYSGNQTIRVFDTADWAKNQLTALTAYQLEIQNIQNYYDERY